MTDRSQGKLSCLPILGVAAIIAIGGGYFAFRSFIGKALTPLESAQVIPQEALLTTFISTDSQSWSQLKQFGTPEAHKLISDNIAKLEQEMFEESNLTYTEDIKPWLGGMMFALLPADKTVSNAASDTDNSSDTNLLMVMGVKNKLKLWNFANKLKEQEKNITEIDYQGIKISESDPGTKNAFSFALVDHKLIASDERQNVEKAIDTLKGESSFASQPGAEKILSQGLDLDTPLAQVYVANYPGLIKELMTMSPQATPIPEGTLKQIEQVESMVMGVGVDDQGLRMQAVGKVDPELIPEGLEPSESAIVSRFPAETFFLMSGRNINQSWSQVVKQGKNNPDIEQFLAQGRQIFKSFGFDLDQDIFSWMDGEYALGVISSQQGILRNLGFGGTIIFGTSDRATSEATMKKVSDIAKQQLPYLTFAQRQAEGIEFVEWQVPQQGAIFGYGWLEDNSLIIALGGPLLDVMSKPPAQPLDQSDSFKNFTDSLPNKNFGYFYLNMDQMMSLVNNLPQAQAGILPPDVKAMLESIDGIGATSTLPNDSTSKVDVIFALEPYVSNE